MFEIKGRSVPEQGENKMFTKENKNRWIYGMIYIVPQGRCKYDNKW